MIVKEKVKESGGISKKFLEMLPNSFWNNLSAAIVYRAALDYEDWLVRVYFSTNQREYFCRIRDFEEVKHFFGSD